MCGGIFWYVGLWSDAFGLVAACMAADRHMDSCTTSQTLTQTQPSAARQIVSSLEEARGQGKDRRSLDDDDGLERGGSSASAFAQAGGGGDKGSNSGLTSALERAKSLTLVASVKAKEIPTPQIDNVPDYEALVDKSYKLPDSYIRTKKLPQILAPGGTYV